jgi:ribosomal protein S18 acetylase RimI-like enzyme
MLISKQLEDIKELQRQCEENDQIQLKLNWDMLRNRDEQKKHDFFHYENGELVAFIGVYGFGHKVELCGMVKPGYRRRGFFSKLLTSALEGIKERKYNQVLLNAPSNSFSAKGFLQNIPCEFSFSEYQMKWSGIELVGDDDVTIRHSKPEDRKDEIQLDILCFGFSEEEATDYNDRMNQEETQQFYMIEYNEKTVGKIRVSHNDKEAWIYGFAIFPEYQGQGIGRKALKKIIMQEHKKGYDIFLEVEAKNSNALRLYESCGFTTIHVQDYYQYIIK